MAKLDAEELQEKLARVIDPTAWKYVDEIDGGQYPGACEALTRNSMEIAEVIMDSGLMTAEEWDRAEYLRAKDRIIECTSRSGRCESVEDLMDGYFKHDPRCPRWPNGAVGGSGCVT